MDHPGRRPLFIEHPAPRNTNVARRAGEFTEHGRVHALKQGPTPKRRAPHDLCSAGTMLAVPSASGADTPRRRIETRREPCAAMPAGGNLDVDEPASDNDDAASRHRPRSNGSIPCTMNNSRAALKLIAASLAVLVRVIVIMTVSSFRRHPHN